MKSKREMIGGTLGALFLVMFMVGVLKHLVVPVHNAGLWATVLCVGICLFVFPVTIMAGERLGAYCARCLP